MANTIDESIKKVLFNTQQALLDMMNDKKSYRGLNETHDNYDSTVISLATPLLRRIFPKMISQDLVSMSIRDPYQFSYKDILKLKRRHRKK